MMTRFVVAFIASLSCAVLYAQNADDTAMTTSVFSDTDLQQHYGIDRVGWTRYQTLMQGNAGVWYKGITPLEVLLIYSRNDAERNRYAENLVMAEDARLEREFASEIAAKLALKRLFPNKNILDTRKLKVFSRQPLATSSNLPFPTGSVYSPGRVVILVGDDGAVNNTISTVLKTQIASGKYSSLNFYFSEIFDVAGIRAWAKRNRIPIALVSSKKVTLNVLDTAISKAVSLGGFSSSQVYLDKGRGFKPINLKAGH